MSKQNKEVTAAVAALVQNHECMRFPNLRRNSSLSYSRIRTTCKHVPCTYILGVEPCFLFLFTVFPALTWCAARQDLQDNLPENDEAEPDDEHCGLAGPEVFIQN